MPPTVILVRHAESLSNIDRRYHIRDPELSYLGVKQAGELRTHLRENLDIAESIELVVASPMRRTLQTASYAFSYLTKRGIPLIANPLWQENSDKPCDTGSNKDLLVKEFPSIDYSLVDALWPRKAGIYGYNREAVVQRGIEARLWLRKRPEKVIAVVTHSAFLRTSVAFARFANADYRIFEFAEGEESSPEMIQWRVCERRGGAMGRSPKGRMGIEPGDFDDHRAWSPKQADEVPEET